MKIDKLNINLLPDAKRVVLQFFFPGNNVRATNIIQKIQKLSEQKVVDLFDDTFSMFNKRHRNYELMLINNFNKIEQILSTKIEASPIRKLLIGSYFSKEFSIEAAALFNPSIVPHFVQSEKGTQKFITSLRATGEGHISSIVFREGTINASGDIELLSDNGLSTMATLEDINKVSRLFITNKNKVEKIIRQDLLNKIPEEVSDKNINSLKNILTTMEYNFICKLLDTNYSIKFNPKTNINERVLFPISKAESMGMEDVRLVKFQDSDSQKYYGTYTAYNGRNIQSQLLETENFAEYKFHSLHGKAVSDKGMALFPRKINDKYLMTSRIDGENMYLMSSDNLFLWQDATLLNSPLEPWEFIQLGNCGSPIELDEGWLLLTHSVGPMRRYVMGAMLLDKQIPSIVKAVLKKPLLEPDENEREGYVPNVVYSCGSMKFNDNLIIPYAVSDSSSSFAKVDINELLKEMK